VADAPPDEILAPGAAGGDGALLSWESGWVGLRREMDIFDSLREEALQLARKMQRASKRAIFCAHRGDTDAALNLLDEAHGHIQGFARHAQQLCAEIQESQGPEPGEEGGSSARSTVLRSFLGEFKAQCSELRRVVWGSAMEEFVEAKLFLYFLASGNVPGFTHLRLLLDRSLPVREGEHLSTSVHKSEYLGALLDFCGEMNRHAVQLACVRDKEKVAQCRDLALKIQAEFLQLDLRNGGLRRKYDTLKYTVRNLERILYDLTLSPSPGGALGVGGDLAAGNGKAPNSTEYNSPKRARAN